MKRSVFNGVKDADDGNDDPNDGEEDNKGDADQYEGEEGCDANQGPHNEMKEQCLNG